MYKEICEEDGHYCPYGTDDFEAYVFEIEGINYIRIDLPRLDTAHNITLRAYLLFTEQDEKIMAKKYFIIKRFAIGEVCIVHIAPNSDMLAGEKLTEHTGDMDYEYWMLACDYARLQVK